MGCGVGLGCVVGVGPWGGVGVVEVGAEAAGEFGWVPASSGGAVAVAAAAVVFDGAVVRGAPVEDWGSVSAWVFGSGRSRGLGGCSEGASCGGRSSGRGEWAGGVSWGGRSSGLGSWVGVGSWAGRSSGLGDCWGDVVGESWAGRSREPTGASWVWSPGRDGWFAWENGAAWLGWADGLSGVVAVGLD